MRLRDSTLYFRTSSLVKPFILKVCYKMALLRLRRHYGKRKMKVGFLVSEIAKWKGQSLYELMDNSNKYEPVILVYPTKKEVKEDISIQLNNISEKLQYFCDHKMRVRSIWDVSNQRSISLSDFQIDIVFYQQPWDIPPAPSPMTIASKILTFYFPYYLVNYSNRELEMNKALHHTLFRYILLNNNQVRLYKDIYTPWKYAGKLVGLGHPIVDKFQTPHKQKSNVNSVIYAPHFTFPVSNVEREIYYSTFLETGSFILEYAKKHPEINWVFKPHPRLRRELVETQVWTKQEVDDYYAEWETIGTSCYTSDYIELFLDSMAMITDCGSFLTEYSCTGNPLIHLVPGKRPSEPNPALEGLFKTFYEAPNNTTLTELLDSIILNGQDPKKEERKIFLQKSGLMGNYAAQNILDYIDKLLR